MIVWNTSTTPSLFKRSITILKEQNTPAGLTHTSTFKEGENKIKRIQLSYIHTYIHTYLIDHSPLGLFRANETNN